MSPQGEPEYGVCWYHGAAPTIDVRDHKVAKRLDPSNLAADTAGRASVGLNRRQRLEELASWGNVKTRLPFRRYTSDLKLQQSRILGGFCAGWQIRPDKSLALAFGPCTCMWAGLNIRPALAVKRW